MTESNSSGLEGAAELFKTLGSPVRLAILRLLASGPMSVSILAAQLDASQPLISQHLRVLRGQRLVSATRDGQQHIYAIADEHVSHIVGDAIEHSKETP